MTIRERFSENCISLLNEAIEEHDGCEIFVVGNLNAEALVFEVTVVARGNEGSVPVLLPFAEKGDVIIHNHPSGVLKPSGADLGIASQLGNQGIGFYIINNKVDRVAVITEPVAKPEIQLLDPGFFEELLAVNGKLAGVFPDYEERPSQAAMCVFVAKAFNDGCLAAAEAGTGVGKSLAYLLPALQWAKNNQERIVISTATIVLQEQLLGKDIPLARRVLSDAPEVVLVKGRGNYLCRMRLAEALEEYTLFKDSSGELTSIKEWSLATKTGSREDLSFFPSEQVWGDVCSEADTCLGIRCGHREECFVLMARREAAKAHVLIVNHHLLFADLAIRQGGMGYETTAVLPPFKRIIFDEAHKIEASATSYFSESFSRLSVFRVLGKLLRQKRGHHAGLVYAVGRKYPDCGIEQAVLPLVQAVRDAVDVLNAKVCECAGSGKTIPLSDISGQKREDYLVLPLKELVSTINNLVNAADCVLQKLPRKESQDDDREEYELRIQLRRLIRIASFAGEFASVTGKQEQPEIAGITGKSGKIFWFESFRGTRREQIIRFVATPLDITPIMRECVLEPHASVIFTSATLAIGESFEYWKSRVGLRDFTARECRTDIFPSPFPYQKQVLLATPEDAPSPDDPGFEEYLAKSITEVLLITEGRGLVLFTSHEMLSRIFQIVFPVLG
ncbi:MAG: helicase c2, partial [Spirochaetaceae bacterium]